MNIEEIEVDYKEKLTDPFSPRQLVDVIEEIKCGKFHKQVDDIRATKLEGEQKKKKKELPSFRPCVANGNLTGVIQFDIDRKHNQTLDFQLLKSKVSHLCECVYAFNSPSGGLKFGILTDLQCDTSIESVAKRRFSNAYECVLDWVKKATGMQFVDDKSMKSYMWQCFFSSDSDLHFNAHTSPLAIDHVIEVPTFKPIVANDCNIHIETLEHILQYIPKDLGFDERRKVNMASFHLWGEQALPVLFNHWSKPERDKLNEQLQSQYKNSGYGHIGTLVNIAKNYGYLPSARNVETFPASLPELFAPNEATLRVREALIAFFHERRNTFLNVSTGVGKTFEVLLYIMENISFQENILYLVQDHELAKEVYDKLMEIRKGIGGRILEDSYPIHIKGRTRVCENSLIRETHDKAGALVSNEVCMEFCSYQGDCAYSQQYGQPHANIRIMTHADWFNEQSRWFHGWTIADNGAVVPRKSGWFPDYIIIDENIIGLNEKAKVSLNSVKGTSLAKIIKNYGTSRRSLGDIVRQCEDEILEDMIRIEKEASVASSNLQSLIKQSKSAATRRAKLKVLDHLYNYVISGEERLLDSVVIKENSIAIVELRVPNRHYENLPTLFLDATANRACVQQCLKVDEFISIPVRKSPNVKIFQLYGQNITKAFLNKESHRQDVVRMLRRLVSPDESVGLITYKSVEDIENYDEQLAGEIGAKVYGHFGAVRGLNKFEDVDCLLIVGRHRVDENAVSEFTRIVFGDDSAPLDNYAEQTVRVVGEKVAITCARTPSNPLHQAVHEHVSQAESIQAIGRGRPIHGKPKRVYYLSDEPLGNTIEIDEFVHWDDVFITSRVSNPMLDGLKSIGFVQDKQSCLVEALGVGLDSFKKNREHITQEILEAGFHRCTVTVFDPKNRNRRKIPYFIGDKEKLTAALAEDGKEVLEISAVPLGDSVSA